MEIMLNWDLAYMLRMILQRYSHLSVIIKNYTNVSTYNSAITFANGSANRYNADIKSKGLLCSLHGEKY